MPKRFSLKSMLIAAAVIAGLLAALATRELIGLVVYISVLLACFILFAPAPTNLTNRVLILFLGVGAGLVGWCFLKGAFGYVSVGTSWYSGDADEIGGWSVGIFIGAWRASVLFSRPPGEVTHHSQPKED
ncbi:MAG: hypothetical protein MI861_01195 [Pirellulales bacterium]|nr:hypothetical protein [Pirellulales bacterium]